MDVAGFGARGRGCCWRIAGQILVLRFAVAESQHVLCAGGDFVDLGVSTTVDLDEGAYGGGSVSGEGRFWLIWRRRIRCKQILAPGTGGKGGGGFCWIRSFGHMAAAACLAQDVFG